MFDNKTDWIANLAAKQSLMRFCCLWLPVAATLAEFTAIHGMSKDFPTGKNGPQGQFCVEDVYSHIPTQCGYTSSTRGISSHGTDI